MLAWCLFDLQYCSASSSEVFCLCLRKYKNNYWLDLLNIKRILSEDKTSVLLRLSYLNLQHKGQIEKYLLQKSLNQDVPKIFLYITIHILGEVFVVTPSTWFLTRYKRSGLIPHIYLSLLYVSSMSMFLMLSSLLPKEPEDFLQITTYICEVLVAMDYWFV